MESIRSFFDRDRYAALTGARLAEVRAGYARAEMEIGDRHLNGVDTAQGGAIFTLADLAFAAASNSHGTVAVAVNVAISFLRAVSGGRLVAEAREEALSGRFSTCVVKVTDEKGELVALFNGTAYRKRETLEEFLRRIKASKG